MSLVKKRIQVVVVCFHILGGGKQGNVRNGMQGMNKLQYGADNW